MADRRPLVIYGAGGFAREVLELVRDINHSRDEWEILGFLDDQEARWGARINDLPVLGGDRWIAGQARKPFIALGVGNPATRMRIANRLRPLVSGFATLVHPSVVRSSYVTIGEGVLITAGNILTANIGIGPFAMLNLMCTVGHDCVIGPYTTLSPGARISGNVTLGEGCDIGTGGTIVQGVTVGEWTIVGAGAVVSKDLPANCTAVGVPAKPIKQREPGWHLR